jgi:competence protein ComEC
MLIAFFLGTIAGVALQIGQATLLQTSWYMACGLFGFAALCLCGLWARCRYKVIVVLAAALLSFGATGWRSVQFLQTALNPALEGADIEVVGVIAAMPQRLDTGLRFRFEVEAAHVNDKPVTLPPRLLLSWYRRAFNDDATAFNLEDMNATPKAGERWQFTLRLKAPHGNANPHGFDYELWLWEQGVQATGYVRENKKQTPPKLLGRVNWNAAYSMERARQGVRDAVFKRLGDAESKTSSGVLAALITGDQNAIERADWDIFRATGVAHLMSISGLHITMFAWLAAMLIGGLWRRSAARAPRLCLSLPAVHAGLLGGLLLATLYAWFSGWGVPAQRTIWMLATMTLLRLSGLRWPWYVTWLLAAVVVLTVDPWALLQAGFWLSFVAVAVLFASDSSEKTSKNRIWRMLREQWIITLALAPLTLLLFQQVSLVGLFANAIAIPVVTLIVTPLAMLGTLIAPLWDMAAQCIVWLAVLLKWLASFPYAVYTVAAPPFYLSVLAVLGGVLLVLPLKIKKRLQAIAGAALLILPAMLWQPNRPVVGQFEMLAIDIGQGNAVLIRTAQHSLLFDAGPRFSRESDAGHRTIVPLLRALGEKLDVLMLSHRDSDHTGGAKAVLAMQPKMRIFTSAQKAQDRMDIGLADDVALEPCYAGQTWTWDGVRFEMLHPQKESLEAEKISKPNAVSCVLKITNSDAVNPKSALLTADIEEAQERSLLGAEVQSTVLLVPHHGSKTSSSEAFLDAVKPTIAIVQAGYRNRFAHPRPEVMARYDERKIQTILSAACGAASWKSDLPDVVSCQREIDKRYWRHLP